jgi:hypothetical protein
VQQESDGHRPRRENHSLRVCVVLLRPHRATTTRGIPSWALLRHHTHTIFVVTRAYLGDKSDTFSILARRLAIGAHSISNDELPFATSISAHHRLPQLRSTRTQPSRHQRSVGAKQHPVESSRPSAQAAARASSRFNPRTCTRARRRQS